MINVYLIPNREEEYPQRGGVREHIVQLKYHLERVDGINILPWRAAQVANIQHMQASYRPIVNAPLVATVHGGFRPRPIPLVLHNLKIADYIVSVADWLVEQFFPQYAYKTVVIPNGVNLDEFDYIQPSGLEPGYVLYMKEGNHNFVDFQRLTAKLPRTKFVTVYWPTGTPIPHNVDCVGLQSRDKMKAIIQDAGLLLSPGSEVCPTAILEAWAAGTPVLARDCDGNAELMRPYTPNNTEVIGGMLYQSVDTSAHYVSYILRNREYFGRQGRERVVKYYQWKDLVLRYKALYEQIMERVKV